MSVNKSKEKPARVSVGSTAGSGETVRTIGQLWRKCPPSWGIDKFVTVESSAGILILCEYLLVGDVNSMRELIRPIKAADVLDCPNVQSEPLTHE